VPDFATAWRSLTAGHQAIRRLVAIGFGTVAFSMQDILLEPYGGQVLHLSVGSTTSLTALLGVGGIAGFVLSARHLQRDGDPYRLAAFGVLAGLVAFTCVIFSAPFHTPALFAAGVGLIGFGGGLFAAGLLTAIMSLAGRHNAGLLLGAWGAVQASAAGLAIAAGGLIRDAGASYANSVHASAVAADPAFGYDLVYHLEILLLFVTLVALGPLVRSRRAASQPITALGLAELTH
jgi:BCD family chlorophyll transporter-like MFS transporter